MSHEIDMSNNRANIAYVGSKLWHGLGQELSQSEMNNIDICAEKSGLNFEVEKRELFYPIVDSDGKRIPKIEPNVVSLVRSDTQESLGVASNRFKVVQPRRALEFFQDLIKETGFNLSVAGSLYGGAKIWAQASIGQDFILAGDDKVFGYAMFSTGFDGKTPTIAMLGNTRVVCANTMTMAMRDKDKKEMRVTHRTELDEAAFQEMKVQLGLIPENWNSFVENAHKLAQTKIDREIARAFFEKVLNEKVETENYEPSAKMKKVFTLYNGTGIGAKLPSADNTLWGAVNAITEYYDHHIKANRVNNDNGFQNRFNSAQFGEGNNVKNMAYDIAVKYADKIAA